MPVAERPSQPVRGQKTICIPCSQEQLVMPRSRHPEIMKTASGWRYHESSGLTSDRRSFVLWCFEPAEQFDPDIATNPRLSPPPLGSTHGRLLPRSMSSGVGSPGEATMETIYPRCAGLDVHKRTVVACVRRVEPTGQAR